MTKHIGDGQKIPSGVLKGVESFSTNDLKHTKTREPASGPEMMQAELAHQHSLKEVTVFNKDNLKNIVVQEKNTLPDKEAIEQEAKHFQFKDGIEKFDKESLTHTETVEKNTLPSNEIIQLEKSA
uniref:Thymosin beta n=1 Tax=Lepeophtheirus salmonis TaxID=72036 RepID=A0A0K2U1G1_LEPSM|nr:uncharacterized protein LOC121126710 [Lepeophtheirus salmonis]